MGPVAGRVTALWYDGANAMRFPVTLLAALLALAGCSAATSEPETGADARVVEVVDGDTIRVEVAGEQESVRLIGINAP